MRLDYGIVCRNLRSLRCICFPLEGEWRIRVLRAAILLMVHQKIRREHLIALARYVGLSSLLTGKTKSHQALHSRLVIFGKVADCYAHLVERRLLRTANTQPSERLEHASVEELTNLLGGKLEPRRLLCRALARRRVEPLLHHSLHELGVHLRHTAEVATAEGAIVVMVMVVVICRAEPIWAVIDVRIIVDVVPEPVEFVVAIHVTLRRSRPAVAIHATFRRSGPVEDIPLGNVERVRTPIVILFSISIETAP
mmetsp:Transcript_26309/g.66807  ORF Transcript_26309/g.66807 Transcript_26309/m.66807 type:complete len:253 (+) Transcript_26309:341-1099(+)